ncbi:MAG: hypothetical protein AB1630_09935 [bacterium]
MMEENTNLSEKEEKEVLEKLYAFVIEQMKAGVDKSIISQKLVEKGVDKTAASELVEKIQAQIVKAAEEEQFSMSSIIPALVGGILAAMVGGVIWGLIVIATGYEIGYVAWGIGLICGFAVVLFSKGKKGITLQIIAVLSSILGIAIGKYITFFHFLKEAIAKEQGAASASNVSIFSEKVIRFFIEGMGSMVSGFDVLWIILAVITAWRIPKGIGIKLQK